MNTLNPGFNNQFVAQSLCVVLDLLSVRVHVSLLWFHSNRIYGCHAGHVHAYSATNKVCSFNARMKLRLAR